MGDSRRFRVLTDFVVRNFPDRMMRIADVAGGNGDLNREMSRRGYIDVVTIDPLVRASREIRRRKSLFEPEMARDFDLLVGMHPDGATDRIVVGARRCRIPFVVVPCCVDPSPYLPFTSRDWIEHLSRLAGDECRQTTLPMRGKNTILYRR